MRARQPAGLALTGQEIASSNTTLNALLGGRQKSWMTGVGSSVRPTPRVQVSQRPDLNILPSPAPSDEPSPQQLPTQESTLSENHNIVNNAFLQNISSHDQPQPSPVLETREQPHAAQNSRAPQPYSFSQAELPQVKQIPPYNRQKTMQTLSSIPSLSNRKPLIDQHIQANGGFETLNAGVERPRFLLLLNACQREDYFYVALHQLFCVWAVDPNAILQIEGFHDPQMMGYAFTLVGKLIRGNEGLSPLHLKWFTDFPSPLKDLLARSDHYRRTVSDVRFFLNKLTTVKSALIQECQQRGFPPLVDEMISCLGLLSPVLQGVFFTASRRTLGIPDDVTGPQMERLFLQDREAHEKLAARYNTAFPPSEREVRERNNWLGQQYLLMRNNATRSDSRLLNQQQPMTGGHSTHTARTASFTNSSRSPDTSQFGHENNTPVHGPDFAGRFQNPQEQSPMDPIVGPQQYIAPNSRPTHQSTHPSTAGSTLPPSYVPSQQTPEQQFVVQMSQLEQQLRINANQIAQPTLQSNHNPTPTSHMASNLYPGAVMSAPVQPTSYQQQLNIVRGQQIIPQSQSHLQQQFQSQNTRQRHASGAGVEPNMQNLRRTSTLPTVGLVNLGQTSGGHGMNSPAVRSTPTESSRRMDHVAQQNSAKFSWHPLLIPRLGENLPPHPPNPDMTALHQAPLRSPYLVPVDRPLDLMHDDPAGRYYQAVLEFAVKPMILPQQCPLTMIDFIVSNEAYTKIPKDKHISVGSPAVRDIRKGSLQYRMRCTQVKSGQRRWPSDFIVAETVWPTNIFMELNGTLLEVRRKLHHGRDLPVDITPLIRPVSELVNRIKISVPRSKGFKNDVEYEFAVEIVEVLQHQQIMDMCLRRRIPAEKTLSNIKSSLSGSFIDDDDDISMVVSDLTINLADPFMARIFDTPVRGCTCLHRECFDLETFLTTRNSKPKAPQQPSMVDVWRCPLCGKDARPYSLRVDDFLVSVRQSLAENDELHAKAIVISADGTWKPKPEASLPLKRSASRAGLDEDDLDEAEEEIKKSEAPTREKPLDVEIIEIADD